jgi:hypothetical protein
MGDKTVTVNVQKISDKEYSISVSEEPVNPGGVGIDEHLIWKITSSTNTWTFANDHGNSTGIDIKGHGKQKFVDKGGGSDHKDHKWRRKEHGDHDGTRFRYTISVIDETAAYGPITLTWDPTIMND